jgi:hypothetical protein
MVPSLCPRAPGLSMSAVYSDAPGSGWQPIHGCIERPLLDSMIFTASALRPKPPPQPPAAPRSRSRMVGRFDTSRRPTGHSRMSSASKRPSDRCTLFADCKSAHSISQSAQSKRIFKHSGGQLQPLSELNTCVTAAKTHGLNTTVEDLFPSIMQLVYRVSVPVHAAVWRQLDS